MSLRRVIGATVVLVSLVAMTVIGTRHRTTAHTARYANLGEPTMPFVPSLDFITSAWFCPGVPVGAKGVGGDVVVVNPADAQLTGRLTVFTDAADGKPVEQPFTVGARSEQTIDIGALQPGGRFASALVEINGGGGYVEQQATFPAGNPVAPCSNSTSANWYFADGFTLAGSVEQLVITNPYPDDAIVNFEFTTSQGSRAPSRLQGFPIPAQSVAVVDQSALPRDEGVLAVQVTATRGRVVMGRAQQYLGGGRLGYTMNLGAPSLGDQFYFADGEKGPGITEQYSIFNPTDTDVVVSAVFFGIAPSDQFPNDTEITVPHNSVATLNTADVAGLPAGRHSLVFGITNGSDAALVIERTLTRPAGDKVATTVVLGASPAYAVQRWSMAIGSEIAVDNILVVFNVDANDGTVTVKALGPGGEVAVPGMENIPITAGGVISIGISDPAALGRPLVVESTRRIFVERLLPRGPAGTTLRGRSGSFALPG